MKRNRIILDAMGGDNAPQKIIKGAVWASKESPSLQVILVGDTDKVRDNLLNSLLLFADETGGILQLVPLGLLIQHGGASFMPGNARWRHSILKTNFRNRIL